MELGLPCLRGWVNNKIPWVHMNAPSAMGAKAEKHAQTNAMLMSKGSICKRSKLMRPFEVVQWNIACYGEYKNGLHQWQCLLI
jgi:hypothetical protein